MKFIHLADCHLSENLKFDRSKSEFIRKTIWQSFEKTLLDNKDADFALISGDLYERNLFSLKDYQKLFDIFENFGKEIFYVTGNHDYISKDNETFFSKVPRNLHIFGKDKLKFEEFGKTRIYGISYSDRICDYNFDYGLKLNKEFFNILLIHADVFSCKTNYIDLNLDKLKSVGFDYVALGHIHKRENFQSNVYYAGSIEPRSFSDEFTYGYNIYDNGRVDVVDSSSMRFIKLPINMENFHSKEEICKYLKRYLSKKYNFLKLDVINSNDDFKLDFLKDHLNLVYLDVNYKDDYLNVNSLLQRFPNSLLSQYIDKFDNLDMNDPSVQRAKELGIDAILRSKND